MLGWVPVIAVAGLVLATLGAGVLLSYLFGRRRAFGLLAGGSVAICGASAALAISSVLPPAAIGRRRIRCCVITGGETAAVDARDDRLPPPPPPTHPHPVLFPPALDFNAEPRRAFLNQSATIQRRRTGRRRGPFGERRGRRPCRLREDASRGRSCRWFSCLSRCRCAEPARDAKGLPVVPRALRGTRRVSATWTSCRTGWSRSLSPSRRAA